MEPSGSRRRTAVRPLLVIRLSALGDVAMTVPVIDAVARRYPDLPVTVLSRPFVEPLFARLPSNVRFRGVDLQAYGGLGGILRLYRELKSEGYAAVADLHDVLRTKILRMLFRLAGRRVAAIDKGRAGKRALTRERNKVFRPLPSSFQRYREVFARLGYPVDSSAFRSIYGEGKGETALFASAVGLSEEEIDRNVLIGIAPFAAHRGKVLPEATLLRLLDLLCGKPDRIVLLFGGKSEASVLETWASSRPAVRSVAGRLSLEGELALMSHLRVMVSMDSANMHLASLTATPVVSVWGATHPYAGFMGWHQRVEDAVQLGLPCRPCSVFGNRPCRRGDYACLQGVKAEEIEEAVGRLCRRRTQSKAL